MNIFVGNLSFDSTGADVKELFEGYGFVASAVIVMEKEKKAPKSRGFGFVQMPDEQQALAAIAALNGKEFMGRVLNVNPARPKGHPAVGGAIAKAKGQKAMVWPPIGQRDMVCLPLGKAIAKAKTEAHREIESKKKMQPKVEVEAGQYPREEIEQKKAWFNPVFNKHLALSDGRVRPSGQHLALEDRQVRPSGRPGTYKGGRRSRSYMKLHGLTGMEDTKPRRRSQDNPMRWRKRKDQPKPWQRGPDEHKPWKKAEEGARPWKKAEGESKPWRKSEGGIKPWKKTGGEIRTWRKPGEEPEPWKKPAGEAKHWRKGRERPQKSKFSPSTSLGMVRGNGERSRTKGRKKSGGYKR